MSRHLSLCLAVCLAFLTGCAAVGPDFEPPAARTEGEWLEAGGKVAGGEIESRWWTLFDDPTLTALVAEAQEQNLDLRLAALRVLEARAQLAVAVGNLYPQSQAIDGSLTYTHQSARDPSSPQPTQAKGSLDIGQDSLGLGASWELDFWGRYRRAVESADAAYKASQADYENALVSLSADVAQTYVVIRTFEERLRIARANVDIQKEGLAIARARFTYGATSERDVAQAESLLASTEATIPALETGLAQAEHALCVLLGLPPQDVAARLGSRKDIPAAPAGVAVGIPADLLRRRPDIRKAEYDAAAQCARIGVAKAALYPAFSLSGNIGFAASTVGTFELSDIFAFGYTSSVGPSVTWPIFNYGRLTNAVRVEDARYQEAIAAYQSAVLAALQEVEDNLVAFLRTRIQAEALARSATAAKRSVDLALLQYREGATDYTTVLTAQQELLTQQDNLAAATGSIAQNMVGLYRALGGGWDSRQGEPLVPDQIREDMAGRTDWGGLLDQPAPAAPGGEPGDGRWRAPEW
jgi:NodT family efflux transporter outer membrane factor (OMF) lipoprotein